MNKPTFQSSLLATLVLLTWGGVFTVVSLLTSSMICGAIVNDDVTQASGSCLVVTARRVLRMNDRWNETEYGEPGENPFPVAAQGVVGNIKTADKAVADFASGNTDTRFTGIPESAFPGGEGHDGITFLTTDEIVEPTVAASMLRTIEAVGGDSTRIYGTANAWTGINSSLGVTAPNVEFRNKDGTKVQRAIYLVKGGGKIDITSKDKGNNTGMVIKFFDLPE
jgi:hypothetical protein